MRFAECQRSSHKTCPTCRQPLKTKRVKGKVIPVFTHDLTVQGLIDEIEVYCSNKGDGCEWQGKKGELHHHLATCEFDQAKLPGWLKKHRVEHEKKVYELDIDDNELIQANNESDTTDLLMRIYKRKPKLLKRALKGKTTEKKKRNPSRKKKRKGKKECEKKSICKSKKKKGDKGGDEAGGDQEFKLMMDFIGENGELDFFAYSDAIDALNDKKKSENNSKTKVEKKQ